MALPGPRSPGGHLNIASGSAITTADSSRRHCGGANETLAVSAVARRQASREYLVAASVFGPDDRTTSRDCRSRGTKCSRGVQARCRNSVKPRRGESRWPASPFAPTRLSVHLPLYRRPHALVIREFPEGIADVGCLRKDLVLESRVVGHERIRRPDAPDRRVQELE